MARHQVDGGRQYGSIVSKAEDRQNIRNNVRRQHKVGERSDQRGLHRQRRAAIERAVIGGKQILGERKRRVLRQN